MRVLGPAVWRDLGMKRQPKHPNPKEMTNGEFATSGGLEVYKLLWGLQGRVGRLEGGFALIILLLGAILTKLQGIW